MPECSWTQPSFISLLHAHNSPHPISLPSSFPTPWIRSNLHVLKLYRRNLKFTKQRSYRNSAATVCLRLSSPCFEFRFYEYISREIRTSLSQTIFKQKRVDSEAIRWIHIITECHVGKSDSYVQHACLFFARVRGSSKPYEKKVSYCRTWLEEIRQQWNTCRNTCGWCYSAAKTSQ